MCYLLGLFDVLIFLVFLVCFLYDFVCFFIRELVVRWFSLYFISLEDVDFRIINYISIMYICKYFINFVIWY